MIAFKKNSKSNSASFLKMGGIISKSPLGFIIFALLTAGGGVHAKISGPAPSLSDPEVDATRSVFGDYRNPLYTSTPQVPAVVPQATAFFNGNVCTSATTCPGNGVVHLRSSAFGQPFARQIPYLHWHDK